MEAILIFFLFITFGHSWSKCAKFSHLRILPKAWSLETGNQVTFTEELPEKFYEVLLVPGNKSSLPRSATLISLGFNRIPQNSF